MALVLRPPFRRATPDDSDAMAEFVDMAGEGLPLYLWSRMAEGGDAPWDVGRRRARRESGSFSYANTVLVEDGGSVAACLIGYRLAAEPEPIDYASMPAMFVPLQELENLAPGTWYVNVLATGPEHRNRGFGGRLLQLADEIAADAGADALSIIVMDANAGARRLYERHGYREVASRPIVKEAWVTRGENWVLLVRRLLPAAQRD